MTRILRLKWTSLGACHLKGLPARKIPILYQVLISQGSSIICRSPKILPSTARMGGSEPPAMATAIEVNNMLFSYCILIALGGLVVIMVVYQIAIHSVRYIRTLTCLNNDSQRYFRVPNPVFGWFKNHVLYAPLFRHRHQKLLHIGPVETGLLPTRFQTLLLVGIITMNVVLCAYGIEWNGPLITKLKHLRNRFGTLAVVNMIPLVIMAGRNNPLIGWLNTSYNTFNLMHRWFGRLVISLAVSHGVVEIMSIVIGGRKTHTPGWESFCGTLKEVRFITFGFVVSYGQQSVFASYCQLH